MLTIILYIIILLEALSISVHLIPIGTQLLNKLLFVTTVSCLSFSHFNVHACSLQMIVRDNEIFP